MAFGGGVVDGGLEDGCRVHAGEQLRWGAHNNFTISTHTLYD